MRKLAFLSALTGGLALLLVGGSLALAKGDHGGARAKLIGFNEVPANSTLARGTFKASIDTQAKTIKYTLQYQGIEGGTAFAAHIHFAQRDVNGGVAAFLCGGGDKPTCPSPGGTVEGTIDAADVIGPANQGISAGQFDELVGALRRGLTYVNVHSNPTFPNGEIRGQIKGRHGDDDDD
jgi:CHRD domain